MQHLTPEALARLVDEAPDRAEAAHLEDCPACHEELEALRRQTAALAALGEAQLVEPPAEHWQAIEAGLAATSLPDDLAGRRRTRLTRTPWFRVAAAVAIYALGTATGLELRARSRSGPPDKSQVARSVTTTPADAAATTSLATENSPFASAGDSSEPSATTANEPSSAQGESGTGRLVANDAGRLHRLVDPSQARTAAEALRYVREAEQAYAQAYARYTELADPQQVEDPVARIAALESIVLTTRQALDRAPADPVINGYHLTAVAQRDAALRQVALGSNGRWF